MARYRRIETIMEREPIRIPITDVCDLHRVQPNEVAGVVEAYLEEANRLGLRSLRIIAWPWDGGTT